MKRTIVMLAGAFLLTAGFGLAADSAMENRVRSKMGRSLTADTAQATPASGMCCEGCCRKTVVARSWSEQRSLAKYGRVIERRRDVTAGGCQ
ncbi:MAG: hypothetical protein HY820_32120 [Acidobacteria bacterium]|nr:hypothetical protein [Acidobacteriota bacterium]